MRLAAAARLTGPLLLAAVLAACGGTSDRALHVTLSALRARAAQAPAAFSTAAGRPSCGASLRPAAKLPPPGAMPAGSWMAQIKARGHLVAGVDQNTLLLASLNPRNGQLEGFEIDILRQIAAAIFGHPGRIEFRALTTAQRLSVVHDGNVDIVADAVTITCDRRRQVDFSTVYFDAHQGVLVPSNSNAQSIGDLAGKRVCATKSSTSIEHVRRYPHLIPYPVDQRTDCLVALQQGDADAIASDDAILRGFRKQDPYAKILVQASDHAPYGMAISKAHPDFLRFVNGVLAQMRADGTWRQIYYRWFRRPIPAPPVARYAR